MTAEDTNTAADQTNQDELTFTLSDEDIRSTLEALHSEDSDTVCAVLDELSPADTADLLC